MRAVIVYRERSDHAREVREYLRDFERRTGRTLEEVDPDTRDGAQLCRLYDIVEYPSIVVVDDDSVMQTMWRGTPLPLIDEVSYYVQ